MINERTTMSFQKTCRNVFSVSLGLVLIGTSNGCTSSFLKSNNKTPVQSNTDWFGFMTKKTSTNPGFQNGNVEADAKTDTKQSRLDLLLAMGHNHENHDDIPAAIRAYDESLQVEKNVEAHHRLGMLYFKKGDKELSNKHLSMAIKLDPNNSDVIADAGYLLYMSGDLANAENMTRASITQGQKGASIGKPPALGFYVCFRQISCPNPDPSLPPFPPHPQRSARCSRFSVPAFAGICCARICMVKNGKKAVFWCFSTRVPCEYIEKQVTGEGHVHHERLHKSTII
jgi:hypothetical protein